MMTKTKLLIVTQAVDLDNPGLGFFHRWIEELATRFDNVIVFCLSEGRHVLPANVEVYSLGKRKAEAWADVRSTLSQRLRYGLRFLRLVLRLSFRYDAVFVHMNQEYILIAGWLWKVLHKPVYLWRNHYAGGGATDRAASLCAKVFCTSKYSYTAKYAKTVVMPVGIDTEIFKVEEMPRKESVLSIGRIAPSKRLEILIDAIGILTESGFQLKAHIYGDAFPQDAAYEASLRQRCIVARLEHLIQFHSGISNKKTPALYGAHELFVNCSESGMYDKTIFEALACGALAIASS